MNIRSEECAWHQAEVTLLNRRIKGIRGFEFKKAVEKEHLFAAGQDPIDIQEGNRTPSGNIKILGFELDALNSAAQAAGYEDILEVPHEAIIIQAIMRKTPASPKTKITAVGVAFQEWAHAMEQNAKMREVTLPFLAMHIGSTKI